MAVIKCPVIKWPVIKCPGSIVQILSALGRQQIKGNFSFSIVMAQELGLAEPFYTVTKTSRDVKATN